MHLQPPFSKHGINPQPTTNERNFCLSLTNHDTLHPVAASPESLTFSPPAKQGDASPPFHHPLSHPSKTNPSSGESFLEAADKVGGPRSR
jgi:hypothetical protein